jgi:hypothetical protein
MSAEVRALLVEILRLLERQQAAVLAPSREERRRLRACADALSAAKGQKISLF